MPRATHMSEHPIGPCEDLSRSPSLRDVPCAVVVPCYNESARLQISQFRSFIGSSPALHFIFVNDGSTDNTLEVLTSLQAELQANVSVVSVNPNGGKAEAVRKGLLHATKQDLPFAGFWDADLATPLSAIHDLLHVFSNRPHVDIVMGSRVKLLGRKIRRNPRRHIIGRVFATVVSNVLDLPVYDTQCGAKLFRVTPEFHAILQEPFQSRWVFDVEILARLIRMHGRNSNAVASKIFEYPLYKWEDIGGSKLRPRDFLRAALDVYRIHTNILKS
jgi:dolichyl-phosphate beta-glucosyltransferase